MHQCIFWCIYILIHDYLPRLMHQCTYILMHIYSDAYIFWFCCTNAYSDARSWYKSLNYQVTRLGSASTVFIFYMPYMPVYPVKSLPKILNVQFYIFRVGQNRMFTPHLCGYQMPVYLMKSLPIILHVHRIFRVGQNRICPYIWWNSCQTYWMYTVSIGLARTIYIRVFFQRNHQIYGHIRCIYTVLANPTYIYDSGQA